MSTRKGFRPPPSLDPEKEKSVRSEEASRFILGDAAKQTPAAPAAPAPATPASVAPAAVREQYPWEEGDPRYLQNFMLRIPETEFLMLKWIAGTTYGESQNSIALAAVRDALEKLLTERGFRVRRNSKGLLEVDP